MGRLVQKTACIFLCILTQLCHADDTCPDVKIVGLSGSDIIAILQGCPGIPGAIGAKGDTGQMGMKGEKGSPGITGKMGPAGEKGAPGAAGFPGSRGMPAPGAAGFPGSRGMPGPPGQPGTIGAKNCKELLKNGMVLSGWHTIYPKGCQALTVFCDMDTDGGGWIVFQRRADGSVDFFRDWAAYKRGFGNQLSEFWLGNDNIHSLTSEGDSLTRHNEGLFSTKDQDNDISSANCAASYNGAWWYMRCHDSNLNGLYLFGEHSSDANGVNWKSGKGYKYSYKVSEMKLRPI